MNTQTKPDPTRGGSWSICPDTGAVTRNKPAATEAAPEAASSAKAAPATPQPKARTK